MNRHPGEKGFQSYEDLEIYTLSKKLAVEIHKMTLDELPKYEMYERGVRFAVHLNQSLLIWWKDLAERFTKENTLSF